MRRIEALALAIARQNDCLNPNSESYATKNPGLIRSYSIDRLVVVNESGIRVFKTFEAGFRCLIGNLKCKCEGKTRAHGNNGKLGADSTLKELTKTFKCINTRQIVEDLQDALEDKALNDSTPLRFFIEEL